MPPKKKESVKRKTRKKAESVPPMDERLEHFAEEVEKLGERFEDEIEEHGDKLEIWFRSTFGVIGPLLSTIFGIIVISIFIWVLGFLGPVTGSNVLMTLRVFLSVNIGAFFILMLFFSYTSYLSKIRPKIHKAISPLIIALGLTVFFWLLAEGINIANVSLSNPRLSELSFYININLVWIFWIIILLGYLFLILECSWKGKSIFCEGGTSMKRLKSITKETAKPRRLYRSGKDKILGGVCGGIAEYLNIDPVIIRFIWIVASFASWGAGILLYIIMWIIMPRNPNHKWRD